MSILRHQSQWDTGKPSVVLISTATNGGSKVVLAMDRMHDQSISRSLRRCCCDKDGESGNHGGARSGGKDSPMVFVP